MKRENVIIYSIATVLVTVLAVLLGACGEPQMPSRVDVNGVLWRIQGVSFQGAPDGLLGFTHCDTKTIELRAVQDNPQEALIHELAHAMVCEDASSDFGVNNLYYNSSTPEAHEGIYRLAALFGSLLQRNPDLAAYLGQSK